MIAKLRGIALLMPLCFFSVAFALTITPKPIIFNQTRIDLTREYQFEHYRIKSSSIIIVPKMIVIHWTSTATLFEAFNDFNPALLPATRNELPGKLNVSAQYLVDRDGHIYQLMPDNWMARHVIGLNHVAIGIENVGGVNDQDDLTDAQAHADAQLILYLIKKYPTIQYLIGHKDYMKFKNSTLWLEQDPNYLTTKYDPSDKFMQRVRGLMQQ